MRTVVACCVNRIRKSLSFKEKSERMYKLFRLSKQKYSIQLFIVPGMYVFMYVWSSHIAEYESTG